MENTLIVNEVELPIKEWEKQRVVTFEDIDKVHGRPNGTAKRNFNENKEHLVIGENYFLATRKELSTKIVRNDKPLRGNPNIEVVLLTQSGYLLLVKSFNDALAWKVQSDLVNSYFKLQEVSYSISEELPLDLQSVNQTIQDLNNNFRIMCEQMNSMENAFDYQFIEFKNMMEKVQSLFTSKSKNIKTISKDRGVSLISPTEIIKPLAKLYDDKSVGYNNTYRKVYSNMDVDWSNRQTRYKNKKGNKNKPSKLLLLESDKKLLKIFTDTVSHLIENYSS